MLQMALKEPLTNPFSMLMVDPSLALLSLSPTFAPDQLTLVGVGPGDPELLTVAA